MHWKATAACVLALAGGSQAAIVNFNFEEYAGNTNSGAGVYNSLNYVKGAAALDISRSSNTAFDIWDSNGNPVPASWGRKHLSPFFDASASDMFVVNISAPGTVTKVTINYGDYGADSGDAHFQAWDAADGGGSQLSNQTQFWNGDIQFGQMGTFTYSGSGIASITFWGEQGLYPNSLYWDNIEIEYLDNVIPLPSVAGLGMAGLVALGIRRRRPVA